MIQPVQKEQKQKIIPQPKQWQFLSCEADIVGYGGAAGGGKTYASVLEPLRHIHIKDFNSVMFRRTSPEILNPGGLWDESLKIYPLVGGHPNQTNLKWKFPSGASIQFKHMEREVDMLSWQGSEVPLIQWEELTHFTQRQFIYMLSRNRSMCGIKPYIRFTCNPDSDSWVAEMIDWYIGADGYIIEERSGVIRYFTVMNGEFLWGMTKEEVIKMTGGERKAEEIKSFTFINAKLEDNQALIRADPSYRGNLLALDAVEQERLLHGNWKIRGAAGLYFKERNFQVIGPNEVPEDIRWTRAWDLAATTDKENSQSARTANVLMGRTPEGRIIIKHADAFRYGPFEVEREILRVAKLDGKGVEIVIPQDPGQAGKAQARQLAAKLAGYQVFMKPPQGDKEYRAKGYSAQAGAGNVYIVEGPWNQEYIREHENFPDGKLKDYVDCSADGFNHLVEPTIDFAFYD